MLLWLILAGPGFLGYGASLLWAGAPKAGAEQFYDIPVEPGNKLVRRKSDQMVTAQLHGFQAPQVRLFAQYKSTSKWEEAHMLPRASGSPTNFCSPRCRSRWNITSKRPACSRRLTSWT